MVSEKPSKPRKRFVAKRWSKLGCCAGHIAKENQAPFLLGDQCMTQKDKEELWHEFKRGEQGALAPGERGR